MKRILTRRQQAILDFGSIADDYSGEVAGKAIFYLATAHYESNNYDEAMANFEKYIKNYHQDRMTTASAIAGIAACLEGKQEFAKAAEKYLEAVDYYPESPSAPDYYYGAVRCYVQADNLAKAEEALDKLHKDYSGTDYFRDAQMWVMKLKAE